MNNIKNVKDHSHNSTTLSAMSFFDLKVSKEIYEFFHKISLRLPYLDP